jgi:hypothetical protein
MIELANTSSGRIVRRAAVPYGSFELSTSGSLIVTASLLRGSLTLLDDQLRIRHITQVAPVTRGRPDRLVTSARPASAGRDAERSCAAGPAGLPEPPAQAG